MIKAGGIQGKDFCFLLTFTSKRGETLCDSSLCVRFWSGRGSLLCLRVGGKGKAVQENGLDSSSQSNRVGTSRGVVDDGARRGNYSPLVPNFLGGAATPEGHLDALACLHAHGLLWKEHG